MSVTIYRDVQGFRYAPTNHGDTLQALALRELGDASRWPELVALNALVPPFIVDDPALAASGLIVSGQFIKVPSAAQQVTTTDADLVFEVDVQVSSAGDLSTSAGDFAMASGRDNLRQALRNRLQTEVGELPFHPTYGSKLRKLMGAANGPTAVLLAATYAKTTLAADSRVQRVTSSKAQLSGDKINVTAEVEPIVGRAISVSESV